MKFTKSQKQIFDKNLNNLLNENLKISLQNIKSSSYKVVIGEDSLDINLKKGDDFLYDNALQETLSMQQIYKQKYIFYPVLYFFGFGNGILFKLLLQNKYLKHIIVFEQDIEIIWTIFHLVDFSKELKDDKIVLFDINHSNTNSFVLTTLFRSIPMRYFLRVYFLELSSKYYEKKFHQEILDFNKKIAEIIHCVILHNGNDSNDALIGINQLVYNLDKMITHPSYESLIKTRKVSGNQTAILIATGPSLVKQLPLLKEVQNKAVLFAADSAYPILYKHGIRPDYVLSLERVVATARYFDNDFKEFDKDIVFIFSHLIHKQSIENLEKNNRNYILALRTLGFSDSLGLNHFGYLNECQSVAHLSFGLACMLNFKNIILIGQDLAFSSDDGSTHASGHVYGNYGGYTGKEHEIDYSLKVKAYGGKGEVSTRNAWNIFRITLQKHIVQSKYFGITTYNCTEGGARIEECIEEPFLQVCNKLLKDDLVKGGGLTPFCLAKQNEFLLRAYARIFKNLSIAQDIKKQIIQIKNSIINSLNNINNANEEEKKFIFEYSFNEIDKLKKIIIDESCLSDMFQALFYQNELNMAKLYVFNPQNEAEIMQKKIIWINTHLNYFDEIYGHLNVMQNSVFENLTPFENIIKERKLSKYRDKIFNKLALKLQG
ncbi:motility associated factor glycosyltransferase family protein [Campylobacter sp. LR185c]|uniref:motility associated factor glycosyltransferase family protein n=1 Tax=Campylobacter sp. LR185c TaxID=2014525 RepID=UPI001237ECC2|nr:6-hydroxymethylpterin diphosphokinase MptE-like protein [Campylobacter sp. LR185c]KAA6225637.1 motility associated factor glycosyltransferase family protein [Campylobacter sp. LR185c]KAA8603847.1 PseD protein [Campylobacter sp. LR185c]